MEFRSDKTPFLGSETGPETESCMQKMIIKEM
jgi:hypothetical protein